MKRMYIPLTHTRIAETTDGDLPFVVYQNFGGMECENQSEVEFVCGLNQSQQAFYGLFVVHERVNLDGFGGFFAKENVKFLSFAIAGCILMHDDRLKTILEQALHIEQTFQAQKTKHDLEIFADVDAAFFTLTDGSYILRRLVSLVRNKSDDFVVIK
jgi:hypothetical protein